MVAGVIIVSAVFPSPPGVPSWLDSLLGRNKDHIRQKARILDVSFNNMILVKVEAISSSESRSITFNGAKVRNSTGDTVAMGIPVPSEVPTGTTMTLEINLDSALTSGTYTVTLVSETVGSFQSPSFTVP